MLRSELFFGQRDAGFMSNLRIREGGSKRFNVAVAASRAHEHLTSDSLRLSLAPYPMEGSDVVPVGGASSNNGKLELGA